MWGSRFGVAPAGQTGSLSALSVPCGAHDLVLHLQARREGLVQVGDQVVVNQCPAGSDSGSVKVR